jgi:hypothetical protein
MLSCTVDAGPTTIFYPYRSLARELALSNISFRSTRLCVSHLDWSKPYDVGGQMTISDVYFVQGGNEYVVHRPALENVMTRHQAHQTEYEDFTQGH